MRNIFRETGPWPLFSCTASINKWKHHHYHTGFNSFWPSDANIHRPSSIYITCSPVRYQAIIQTNAGILLIEELRTTFSESCIKIKQSSYEKMKLKMLSAKWQPFFLSLNVTSLFFFLTARFLKDLMYRIVGVVATFEAKKLLHNHRLLTLNSFNCKTGLILNVLYNLKKQIPSITVRSKYMYICAHFCYKMVRSWRWDWCIVGFVQEVYWPHIHYMLPCTWLLVVHTRVPICWAGIAGLMHCCCGVHYHQPRQQVLHHGSFL